MLDILCVCIDNEFALHRIAGYLRQHDPSIYCTFSSKKLHICIDIVGYHLKKIIIGSLFVLCQANIRTSHVDRSMVVVTNISFAVSSKIFIIQFCYFNMGDILFSILKAPKAHESRCQLASVKNQSQYHP